MELIYVSYMYRFFYAMVLAGMSPFKNFKERSLISINKIRETYTEFPYVRTCLFHYTAHFLGKRNRKSENNLAWYRKNNFLYSHVFKIMQKI